MSGTRSQGYSSSDSFQFFEVFCGEEHPLALKFVGRDRIHFEKFVFPKKLVSTTSTSSCPSFFASAAFPTLCVPVSFVGSFVYGIAPHYVPMAGSRIFFK
jgi:hypothetical protein